MLAAIKFNDEMLTKAYKIHDVSANRLLAAEFKTIKLPILQSGPKQQLGLGLTAP